MQVKIYGLTNPIDNSVFYIGATSKDLTCRVRGHVGTNRVNKKCSAIIDSILEKGLYPEIFLIEEVDSIDAQFNEDFYISLLKYYGYELTNINKSSYASHKHMVKTKSFTSLTISLPMDVYEIVFLHKIHLSLMEKRHVSIKEATIHIINEWDKNQKK